MVTKRFPIIIILLITTLGITAQKYISLKDGSYVDEIKGEQCVRDIQYVDDGVVVTYNFRYVTAVKDPLYPQNTFLSIRGFGQNNKVGTPSFPKRLDSFTIPEGKTAQILIEESEYIELPIKVSPARPLISENLDVDFSKETVLDVAPYLPITSPGFLAVITTSQVTVSK